MMLNLRKLRKRVALASKIHAEDDVTGVSLVRETQL